MERQKKSIANDEIISTADMNTAKEQFATFLTKGHAPCKYLLKYLCGTGMIRVFDYGRTFAQFYAEFTKRLDTLPIFISTLMQAGLQFCINLALSNSEEGKQMSISIKTRLGGFNEFMVHNVLPLTNDPTNNARKCWFKLEAILNLMKDLKTRGKNIESMDDPHFKLAFYEFQQRNLKLPSVDAMAKDLLDLDKRLNKKGGKGGSYYQHQWHPTYYPEPNYKPHYPNHYQFAQRPSGYQPYHKREPLKHNKYGHPHPHRRKERRGRDRRDRDKYDRDRIEDRGRSPDTRERNRNRTRSRSRSRERRPRDHPNKVKPDFIEGYNSMWDRKKAQYILKNGLYWGEPKLEGMICNFFKDPKRSCTYGYKRCKWHHMCNVCFVIGSHNGSECPERGKMRV